MTVTEWVKARHALQRFQERKRLYRPVCQCGRLRSKWKPYEDALRTYDNHVAHEIEKEYKFRERTGSNRKSAAK